VRALESWIVRRSRYFLSNGLMDLPLRQRGSLDNALGQLLAVPCVRNLTLPGSDNACPEAYVRGFKITLPLEPNVVLVLVLRKTCSFVVSTHSVHGELFFI
jgi:hypothetical protein